MSRIRPGELFSFCNLRIPGTLFWAIISAAFVHQEQQFRGSFLLQWSGGLAGWAGKYACVCLYVYMQVHMKNPEMSGFLLSVMNWCSCWLQCVNLMLLGLSSVYFDSSKCSEVRSGVMEYVALRNLVWSYLRVLAVLAPICNSNCKYSRLASE